MPGHDGVASYSWLGGLGVGWIAAGGGGWRRAIREHLLDGVGAGSAAEADRADGGEPLAAEDIADAITYIVTRPRRVAVNELLIRPREQEA